MLYPKDATPMPLNIRYLIKMLRHEANLYPFSILFFTEQFAGTTSA